MKGRVEGFTKTRERRAAKRCAKQQQECSRNRHALLELQRLVRDEEWNADRMSDVRDILEAAGFPC